MIHSASNYFQGIHYQTSQLTQIRQEGFVTKRQKPSPMLNIERKRTNKKCSFTSKIGILVDVFVFPVSKLWHGEFANFVGTSGEFGCHANNRCRSVQRWKSWLPESHGTIQKIVAHVRSISNILTMEGNGRNILL